MKKKKATTTKKYDFAKELSEKLKDAEVANILINKVNYYEAKRNRPPNLIVLSDEMYSKLQKEMGVDSKKGVSDLSVMGVPVHKQSECITTRYVCQDCRTTDMYGENLERHGDYKIGLTDEEIKEYLKYRNKGKINKTIMKKFNKIAGVNTVGVGPEGQHLMYRHDVKRFADSLFNGTPTYWD